jgi:hypothetical protein
MPAPRIEQPLGGDDFIVVRSSIPGATIRVRVGTTEIGDGAGNPIALTRPLVAGEVLIVTQQLGTCNASQAFSITAL